MANDNVEMNEIQPLLASDPQLLSPVPMNGPQLPPLVSDPKHVEYLKGLLPAQTGTPRTYIMPADYNTTNNENLALELALKLSRMDLKDNPDVLYQDFVDAFEAFRFKDALHVREEAKSISKEALSMIDQHLDKIPWRISCESYQEHGKVKWFNSWIKVGWWPQNKVELSPQLISGQWIATSVPHAIDTNKFTCVVMRGTSKDMLLHILEVADSPRVNIELQNKDGYLIPVDIAFSNPKYKNSMFDLAMIEFGSLTDTGDFNLDALRISSDQEDKDEKVQTYFFRGCTLGSFHNSLESFLDSDDILDSYDSDDDILDSYDSESDSPLVDE